MYSNHTLEVGNETYDYLPNENLTNRLVYVIFSNLFLEYK